MAGLQQAARRTIRSKFDLAIIGGGIVGLATARQVLLRFPKVRVCVVEKEKELATHQSKRNSGVVHCGIYYKKNSLKSRFCISGAKMVRDYCKSKQLPYVQCGKLIVATEQDELETLNNLYENAIANKIEGIQRITKGRIRNIQPGCDGAIEAIWSPNTAIVDWRKVALSYADDFEKSGGVIIKDYTVFDFEPDDKYTCLLNAKNDEEIILAKAVVNCAGAYSDYFARRTGNNEHPKVVPFKGRYFLLADRLAKTIRTNIYPVPNPKVPFLGVHITPRVDGSVLIGPTSLLSLGYENYEDEGLRFVHLYHILWRSGFIKMLKNSDYIEAGVQELLRFFSKTRVAQDVAKFLPEAKVTDLVNTKFCGIRAQVVDKDGTMVDDFLFESGDQPDYQRVIHLRNCPSPAATSSLAIAERVVKILEERLL